MGGHVDPPADRVPDCSSALSGPPLPTGETQPPHDGPSLRTLSGLVLFPASLPATPFIDTSAMATGRAPFQEHCALLLPSFSLCCSLQLSVSLLPLAVMVPVILPGPLPPPECLCFKKTFLPFSHPLCCTVTGHFWHFLIYTVKKTWQTKLPFIECILCV